MPDTTPIAMLWEPDDPQVVLSTRFGHRDAASATAWLTTCLGQHWGLRVESYERIVMSDRNALAWAHTPSGRMLAKWSVAPERYARLARVARLTVWLDQQGLPVSAPLAGTAGQAQVEVDGVSVSVQRVMEAELLDVGDPAQVRAAGAALARLHVALAAYPEAEHVVAAADAEAPVAARIVAWLDSAAKDVEHVPAAPREALRRLVASAPADLPTAHLVHGDFRSANVLCVGGEVAAVLDLEEVHRDHAVVELVRSAVMLGTRFHDWGPVPADVRRTLRAGYESVRPLTSAEARWWDVLELWFSCLAVPRGADPTGWADAAADVHARSRPSTP